MKILVPTDFSTCADIALDTAILIAKKINAEIHLLHSLDETKAWHENALAKEGGEIFIQSLQSDATSHLNERLQKY